MRVEGFIAKHNLDKCETILGGFSHFELAFTVFSLHETLEVIDFECFTVLLLRIIEKSND